MVNWGAKESFTKLLAAIYAAHPDVKFNFNEIAHFFGDGATYDAIEGRFRIIKKEAMVLHENAGEPGPSTNRKRKTASQRSVLTGRVTKRGGRGRKAAKPGTVKSDEEAGESTQAEYEDDEES